MYEQILAGIVLAVCAVLLLRLAAGPSRRMRVDAALRHAATRTRASWSRLWRRRAVRRSAAREAREVIERARRSGGEWDGNVYRPKSFRRPKKPH